MSGAVVLASREDITRTAYGEEPSWILGIVFDRGPDARDVIVDAAIERLHSMPTQVLHELVSGQNASGIFCKD